MNNDIKNFDNATIKNDKQISTKTNFNKNVAEKIKYEYLKELNQKLTLLKKIIN